MKKILLFVICLFAFFINVFAKEEYLKNILIDGESLEDFVSSKTEYDLTLPSDKESIKVTYEYDSSLYKGKGNYGNIELKYGLNEITYTLTNKKDGTDSCTYKINITREDGRSSENSLSSLTVSGNKVELSEKLEYDVLVNNNLTQVDIKAVLKDQRSSFVDGYGERIGSNLVKLSGEKTQVEIKVKAENETIKTYVINIIKKDYKNNDATLKSLKVDEINFNFKSNIYEYELSVDNEIKEINLNAISNDEKTTLIYEKKHVLVEGKNDISIKVKAEDGTVKEYILKITREKEIPIVNNIEIENFDIQFNPNVFEYEVETDLTTLNFNVTLSNEKATLNILNNENLENGSIVKIEVKENDKTLVYNFKIVNEDKKNNDNENEDIKTESFLEKYEMIIGLGVFGLGILMLLIAILTRPKKSQIM